MVTTTYIRELVDEAGVRTPLNVVIQRLSERGWLLRTGVRGVWEFAPAERAGPYSDGDPLSTLRATLSACPDLPAAAALGTAMWLLDLADRAPNPAEVALPPGVHIPIALKRTYLVVRCRARLRPVRIRGIPVHRSATVLVHLAHRPSDVRSWSVALERLPDLVDAAAEAEIVAELEGRGHATHVRLAYLLSKVAPELVDSLGIEPAGKVWFGPRGKLRRHDARWNIADTILPFSPMDLEASRATVGGSVSRASSETPISP